MKSLPLCVLVLYAILVGCGAATVDDIGKTVPENKRIPLKEGETLSSVLDAFEFTMNYQYRLDRDNITNPGKFSLSGSIRSTRGVDRMSLWVNFLDADGKILAHKSAFIAPKGSGFRNKSFKAELETPPGTAAISFHYNAWPREEGGF